MENSYKYATPEAEINDLKPIGNEITMVNILSRIDKIIDNTEYITEALNSLKSISPLTQPSAPHSPGDIAGKAKAEAIAGAVKARETTNQQLISLLEKMYSDISPVKSAKSSQVESLEAIARIMDGLSLDSTDAAETLQTIVSLMFKK